MHYFDPILKKPYSFSYKKLVEDYERFCEMSDEEFMASLPKVLHFACFVGFIKEFDYAHLSDDGIIHQLVHLLDIPNEPLIKIKDIRKQFEETLKLSR